MRGFRLGLTSLSSLVFIIAAPGAAAGSCGTFSDQSCNNPGVVYNASGAPSFDPVNVNVAQPLSGSRSFHIRTAPSVSITRLYSQPTLASVGDNPSGFTGGCNPTTTQYCRQNVATPVNVSFAPQIQQIQAPIIAAPIRTVSSTISPIVTPTVRFGSGFNPAAAQPRQYGEDVFTPGIAHVPTSYVDRNPATAERLLASGITRSHNSLSLSSHSVSSGPTTAVEADGGYWEQVAGPTLFGDTLATQVVCRRQAPVVQQQAQVQRQVYTQVVRPVIAVPTPVPVHCEPTVVHNRYGFAGQALRVPSPQFSGLPSHNGLQQQGPWKF